jgi:hypothetical protein
MWKQTLLRVLGLTFLLAGICLPCFSQPHYTLGMYIIHPDEENPNMAEYFETLSKLLESIAAYALFPVQADATVPTTREGYQLILDTEPIALLLVFQYVSGDLYLLEVFHPEEDLSIFSITLQLSEETPEQNQKRLNDVVYQLSNLLLKTEIKITTDMPNVEVYYKNEYMGRTPLNLEVNLGIYELLLYKQGFQKEERKIEVTPESTYFHLPFGQTDQTIRKHHLYINMMIVDFMKPKRDRLRIGFALQYAYQVYKHARFKVRAGFHLGAMNLTRQNTAVYHIYSFTTQKEFTLFPLGILASFIPTFWKFPIYPIITASGGICHVSVAQDHFQRMLPFYTIRVGALAEVKFLNFLVEWVYQDYTRVRILELTELQPSGNHHYNEKNIAVLGFSLHAAIGYKF